MGSTRCKGGLLQEILQLNQATQTPKIINVYKDYTSYNNEIYKEIQYTQDRYKSHPRAKHAPSGFYPTWTAFTGIYPLKHLRMKQVMLPQVGYSSTCLSTPQK